MSIGQTARAGMKAAPPEEDFKKCLKNIEGKIQIVMIKA